MATIYLENIQKQFNQSTDTITVLSGITQTFVSAHTYALTGVSGTGKSTLLSILAGLEEPTLGSVYYNNHNTSMLTHKAKNQLLNQTIGLVFQMPYLIHELSVLENIMIKGLISPTSSVKKEDALQLLDRVGLSSKANFLPATLSGGEQQRVAIARAVVNNPDFILADEPTAHLDERNREAIMTLLLDCQKEYGTGLIIACHDPAVWQKMDTILELHHGLIQEKNH
ncbi:ABC transporter ATP-binding protein [Candidatus Dependentiae bacterium]|nr:ABC transporter ATP-binding protein [Candidatus Dependentiae bacterium]